MHAHPMSRSSLPVAKRVSAWRVVAIAVALSGATLLGCGGAAEPPKKAAPEADGKAPPPAPELPPGSLAREEVDKVLLVGPSWVFKRVLPEEVVHECSLKGRGPDGGVDASPPAPPPIAPAAPAKKGGFQKTKTKVIGGGGKGEIKIGPTACRFLGWRIVAMPDEWRVDLQPGDVVMTVNGMGLERPTDVWAAWTSVAKAKDVTIAIERNGAKKDVVLKIVGEPKPETAEALANGRGGGGVSRGDQPRGTIVIEERAPEGDPKNP
jgi:hypothetical protein